jgi:TM2 domain-containing protein
MRTGIFFLFSLFFFIPSSSNANNSVELSLEEFQVILKFQETNLGDSLSTDSIATPHVKFQRGKAILFTVFTGFLGGHRIYLGTHQRTPIIYSVTLGGLGILPLIDLVQIIFTKDLSKFEYRPQIIMWGK